MGNDLVVCNVLTVVKVIMNKETSVSNAIFFDNVVALLVVVCGSCHFIPRYGSKVAHNLAFNATFLVCISFFVWDDLS